MTGFVNTLCLLGFSRLAYMYRFSEEKVTDQANGYSLFYDDYVPLAVQQCLASMHTRHKPTNINEDSVRFASNIIISPNIALQLMLSNQLKIILDVIMQTAVLRKH